MGFWNSPFYDKKKDLVEVVEKFLSAYDVSDACQVLEQHPELLNEETDSIFDAFSKDTRSDEILELIQDRRNLLAHYREVSRKKELLEVIGEFLKASKAGDDACQILEQHPELLSKETDSILYAFSKDIQNDGILTLIQNRRNTLARCREVGVAQAFEEINSSDKTYQEDLQTILKEINRLSTTKDIPRKIMLLQRALSLVRHQSNPKLWAALQVTLGESLHQNPQENQADNIEQAIELYNQALNILNQAIEDCKQAFNIVKKEEFLELQKEYLKVWATAQRSLATAYKDRIREDKVENIEKAIKHFNQALEIFTRENFPEDWAATLNNLGLAYWSRIKGDKAENIEKSIENYHKALEVFTRQEFSKEWAGT